MTLTTTTARRSRTAIAVALTAVMLTACGGGDDESATSSTATDTSAAATADDDTMDGTEPAASEPMATGAAGTEPMPSESRDSATDDDGAGGGSGEAAGLPAPGELDGRRVTVESVGAATLNFTEPEEGMEAIFIEVTVENVSAEPWNSNMVQFFLVDANGNEIGPELMGSEAGDTLPDVDALGQGESSTGFIAYQVPPDSPLTLRYAVDLAEGRTIEIPIR